MKINRKFLDTEFVETCDELVIMTANPENVLTLFVVPPTLVIAIITTQFIIIEHRISPV